MSTVNRFPSMIDYQFERERIFQKEIESKKKEVKIAKPDESKPQAPMRTHMRFEAMVNRDEREEAVCKNTMVDQE